MLKSIRPFATVMATVSKAVARDHLSFPSWKLWGRKPRTASFGVVGGYREGSKGDSVGGSLWAGARPGFNFWVPPAPA